MDQGARMVTIDKEGNNNPFAFKKSDVEQGDSGLITGGKRSQFEQRAGAAYADANSQAPAYLKKSYNRKTWAGPKDYSTGSYKTSGFRQADQRSGFGNRKATKATKLQAQERRGLRTGSYRTGSSSESGRKISTGSSSYVDQQARDGWRRLKIIESDEYRSISMGQAKSLLGR